MVRAHPGTIHFTKKHIIQDMQMSYSNCFWNQFADTSEVFGATKRCFRQLLSASCTADVKGRRSINADRCKCEGKIVTSSATQRRQVFERIESLSPRSDSDGSLCRSHLASGSPTGQHGQFFGSGGRLLRNATCFADTTIASSAHLKT